MEPRGSWARGVWGQHSEQDVEEVKGWRSAGTGVQWGWEVVAGHWRSTDAVKLGFFAVFWVVSCSIYLANRFSGMQPCYLDW